MDSDFSHPMPERQTSAYTGRSLLPPEDLKSTDVNTTDVQSSHQPLISDCAGIMKSLLRIVSDLCYIQAERGRRRDYGQQPLVYGTSRLG